MQIIDKPNVIEINPPQKPIGSVIWLHGLGADGSDFLPIVPELQLPTTMPLRFIFPNAPKIPVTVNNGYVMPAWYDILAIGLDREVDHAGIEQSTKLLHQLIEHENQLGVPSENIIVAGFSQGAVIALTAGLTYNAPLGGILALSGYLPNEQITLSTASKTTPVFVGHGSQDTVVPEQLGQRIYQFLQKNNYHVDWHSYPMPHSVCAEEVDDIANWMKGVFVKVQA